MTNWLLAPRKLTAMNDFLDETTLDFAKVASASLVDMRSDKQGHASHLILTKVQSATVPSAIVEQPGDPADSQSGRIRRPAL